MSKNPTFPPPLVFVIGLALGYGLHRLWPVPVFPEDWLEIRRYLTWFFVGSGILFFLWAVVTMFAAGTSPEPHSPAEALVTHGPYQFSRNPIYAAFSLIYIGVAMGRNWLWVLLLLPPVLWLLGRWIIRGEERYLTDLFGEPYREYCQRVRRWL